MGRRKEVACVSGKGKKPSLFVSWTVGVLIILLAAWSRSMYEKKPSEVDAIVSSSADEDDGDWTNLVRERLLSDVRRGTGFATAGYWEQRYATTKREHYDWYGTWNSPSKIRLKPHVQSWLPERVSSVLNVGCGNSRFAEELINDGFEDVVSIDIAQSVIDKMSARFQDTPGTRFMQMDATSMAFSSETFDVVFEKGTLDAMYSGAPELVKLAVGQIFRVLRPGGCFCSLSVGDPDSRKALNYTDGAGGDEPAWERHHVQAFVNGDENDLDRQHFWMYLFRKPFVTPP